MWYIRHVNTKSVRYIDVLTKFKYTKKMKDISKTLEKIGLNRKESLIYTVLLKGGKMTVTEISKSSDVKRATVYEYINTLLLKDFIVRVPVGKRMFYSATNPKKILANFENKKKSLEASMDEMLGLFNESIDKPKVLFYEGKRELRKIYDDIFQSMGDTYSIFPPKSFFSNFSEREYAEFDKVIKSNSFKMKDLMVQQEGLKKVLAIREKQEHKDQQTKILPKWFESNVDVIIYENKVALISLGNLSAIVIENKDIGDFFKNIHKFLWSHS